MINTASSEVSFYEKYQNMKTQYHEDIAEIFSKHFTTIFGETEKNTTPENICAPFYLEAESSAQALTLQIDTQYQYYKCTLLELSYTPRVNTSNKPTLFSSIGELQSQEQTYLNEIEDSYTAKELTMQTYQEMRMWYPVHRNLQCLIQELTDYNSELRNFVDRIVIIPKKFLNYGSRQPL